MKIQNVSYKVHDILGKSLLERANTRSTFYRESLCLSSLNVIRDGRFRKKRFRKKRFRIDDRRASCWIVFPPAQLALQLI